MKQPILYNESELITRLRESDTVAFEEVFSAFYAPLKAFAFRELKGDRIADDVVQEVFCKLWNHRKKLRIGYSLRGFLFTSLKNHILNTIRTRQREVLKNQRYFLRQQSAFNQTEHQVVSNEIQRDIRRLIDELPEVKRQILLMNVYQGLSKEQIAQQLNLSVHTVKIYLSESSRRLRQLIHPSQANLLLVLLLTCY